MSVELKLKEEILKKHKSIRAFTEVVDIPYSTLVNILKNGIAKAGINTMIKICKELDIDTDALSEGEIKGKKSKIDFCELEQNYIRKYRTLDQMGKHTVDVVLNMEFERVAKLKENKESVDDVYIIPIAARSGEKPIIKTSRSQIEADILKLPISDEDDL